jgi:putative endopeptidase
MRRIYPTVFAGLLFVGLCRADFVPADFDSAVKPQNDFYHYVNGGWLKNTPIPADHSHWGTIDELRDRSRLDLRRLCERASAQADQGTPIERMVGDFFASGLDPETINQAGAQPLRFEFDRIDALQTPAQVLTEIAHLQGLGVDVGFSFGSEIDIKDSTREIAAIGQGGLGLPDRDYYFRPEDQALRDQYVAHIARMLMLLGGQAQTAPGQAAAVLKLETALAGSSFTAVQLRDPVLNYHKMTLAEAEAAAPGLALRDFFAQTTAPAFAELDVAQPEFLEAFAAALAQTSIADWRSYLRWHFVHEFAPYLSASFVREDFSFYGTALTGAKQLRPQWERVVMTIDRSIGDALSQLYVAEYFPPASKARVAALVGNIRAELRERITGLPWMDAPTRAAALAKLDALAVKVGYPDGWRNYSYLVIDRGPYVLNVLKSEAFESRRQLKKIGQPADRSEWDMTAATVNAYYDQNKVEIVFPAAILQPPFFDAKADDAVNYGAIGALIGHELTHGFDDQGHQFDLHGNLADWWTPESAAQFKQRAAAIVKQFDGYAVFPDLHVNGALTQGENIADLGGVKIAYAALEKTLAGQARDPIGGFTPEQRFFLSFATWLRMSFRPAVLRLLVNTDPHSPAEFRVNGPLSNLDEFAAAFQVPDGAPMRRPAADRVSIW